MKNHLTAISLDEVEAVIRLALIKATHEGKDLGGPLLVSVKHEPRPERDRLVAAIKQLPVPARVELFALMELGQDAFEDGAGGWDGLLAHARQELRNNLADQMAAKAQLHEYLRRGLEMLG